MTLLTLYGAQHGLGGIDAYGGIPQTPAENPATVALVEQATTSYLRTALGVDPTAWTAAQQAIAQSSEPAGMVESR